VRWTDRRRRFRAILEGSSCVYPGSVFDPISARIAEDLGFELGMLAGSIASFTTLGDPDVILITLTEFAGLARRIGQAGNLPLLVDADHGYGNAMNVMRTVEELEIAGIAGLTIEDTQLPAAYGTTGKAGLVSLDEGIGKMRAALAARHDPDLAIVGRTSGLTMVGLDQTITRIRAYEAAGVDAIFIAGLSTVAELEAIAGAVRLPLLLGSAEATLVNDRALLAAHNVRVCLQGHLPFMAAVQAVRDTLAALRAGTPPEAVAGVAPPALMKTVTRAGDFAAREKAYLGV
jgi:carboxyvinyl-carboxyphosphonate phosphorylmutase